MKITRKVGIMPSKLSEDLSFDGINRKVYLIYFKGR